MSRRLVYLACPYSHPDREVRVKRFEMANRIAAKLVNEGNIVFSPISHTHPIAEAGDLSLGWDYWSNFDRVYVEYSKKLIVIKMEGWETSKGVCAELEMALEGGIPIEYIEPMVIPK